MTNPPKFSSRARKALDVLSNGGRFVHRLERNSYTGREQFEYRLILEGRIQKGVGMAAFYELRDAGFLKMANSTSVSTHYKLNTGA